MGVIYCYTNLSNGKKYIGQTLDQKHRKSQHKSSAFNKNSLDYNSPLHRSFRKYGYENFEYTTLATNIDDIEILNILQKYYISKFNTQIPNGYNIEEGGTNSPKPKTEQHKQKLIWGQAKLTEEEVIELRKAYQEKKSPTEIYNNKYKDKLHYNSFLNIWTGKRYGLIMPEVFEDKGRHTKLTEDIVRQIKIKRRDLNLSYEKLANEFGVSKGTIADIIKERTWKQVQI